MTKKISVDAPKKKRKRKRPSASRRAAPTDAQIRATVHDGAEGLARLFGKPYESMGRKHRPEKMPDAERRQHCLDFFADAEWIRTKLIEARELAHEGRHPPARESVVAHEKLYNVIVTKRKEMRLAEAWRDTHKLAAAFGEQLTPEQIAEKLVNYDGHEIWKGKGQRRFKLGGYVTTIATLTVGTRLRRNLALEVLALALHKLEPQWSNEQIAVELSDPNAYAARNNGQRDSDNDSNGIVHPRSIGRALNRLR